jgi:hypothetical protein
MTRITRADVEALSISEQETIAEAMRCLTLAEKAFDSALGWNFGTATSLVDLAREKRAAVRAAIVDLSGEGRKIAVRFLAEAGVYIDRTTETVDFR